MMRRFPLLAAASLLTLFLACAGAQKDNIDTPEPSGPTAGAGGAGAGGAGAAGATAGGAGSGGSTAGQAGTGPDGGGVELNTPDAPAGDLVIYAHTDLTLYQVDPKNPGADLVTVGAFDCVGDTAAGQDKAMTDLAVDRNQNLWGVSQSAVYKLKIEGTSVHCEQTIKLQNDAQNPDAARFYGLTFAPIGTLNPDKEVLVAGNTAGELWAVDDQGVLKLLGHMGDVPANDGNGNAYDNKGKRWELSGDLVFVEGKAGEPLGFATVRDCPNPPSTTGCNNVNSLIEIDMKKLGKAAPGSMLKSVRGQIVERKGCADKLGGDYGNMFGISAWNDKVYGFSRDGHLVDISLADGSACLVHTFDGEKFSGAGVTTVAPVEAPPIK